MVQVLSLKSYSRPLRQEILRFDGVSKLIIAFTKARSWIQSTNLQLSSDINVNTISHIGPRLDLPHVPRLHTYGPNFCAHFYDEFLVHFI
jgi:hypothetical protein